MSFFSFFPKSSFAEENHSYQKYLNKRYVIPGIEELLNSTPQMENQQMEIFLSELLDSTDLRRKIFYKDKISELKLGEYFKFLMAKKSIKDEGLKEASKLLSSVSSDQLLYPESQLLVSVVFHKLNLSTKRDEALTSCEHSSKSFLKKTNSHMMKRYFQLISEICLINNARYLFDQGEYSRALSQYDRLPKISYKWPSILLEKAWAYYHLGDYNRALGLLVTYKSPLLQEYLLPEAQYLAALSYFKLCLLKDSLSIIDQFQDQFVPTVDDIDKIIYASKNESQFIFEFLQNKGQKKTSSYLNQFISRKKNELSYLLKLKFLEDLFSEINKLNQENEKFDKMDKIKRVNIILDKTKLELSTDFLNDLKKLKSSITFFHQEILKIKVEILSKERNLVYSNIKIIPNRKRGDLSNIQKSRFEYFWRFHGEFWADELGDYTLGLKSSCDSSEVK